MNLILALVALGGVAFFLLRKTPEQIAAEAEAQRIAEAEQEQAAILDPFLLIPVVGPLILLGQALAGGDTKAEKAAARAARDATFETIKHMLSKSEAEFIAAVTAPGAFFAGKAFFASMNEKYTSADGATDFASRVAEYEATGGADFGPDGIAWLAQQNIVAGEPVELPFVPPLTLEEQQAELIARLPPFFQRAFAEGMA